MAGELFKKGTPLHNESVLARRGRKWAQGLLFAVFSAVAQASHVIVRRLDCGGL